MVKGRRIASTKNETQFLSTQLTIDGADTGETGAHGEGENIVPRAASSAMA